MDVWKTPKALHAMHPGITSLSTSGCGVEMNNKSNQLNQPAAFLCKPYRHGQ